ncbi:MAG: hypothetical protein KDD70_15425 [Bdellovibrionales bacterium]|nr:hypothetical protein [Bdellovibrionales bacterium]
MYSGTNTEGPRPSKPTVHKALELTPLEIRNLISAEAVVNWFSNTKLAEGDPRQQGFNDLANSLQSIVIGRELPQPVATFVHLRAVSNLLDYLNASHLNEDCPECPTEEGIDEIRANLVSVSEKLLASSLFSTEVREATSLQPMDPTKQRELQLAKEMSEQSSPEIREIRVKLVAAAAAGTRLHERMHDEQESLPESGVRAEVEQQLSTVVRLARDLAAKTNIPTAKEPYDVLLHQFDPDIKAELLDDLFKELLTEQAKILESIEDAKNRGIEPSTMPVLEISQDEGIALCRDVVKRMGWKWPDEIGQAGHPSAYSVLSPNFAAILLGSEVENPLLNLLDVRHEAGHALLASALSPDLRNSPLLLERRGVSMALDESAAMFAEILIGKGDAYWKGNYTNFQAACPALADTSATDFIQSLHSIPTQPSAIRLQSDDLRYPLHIIIRYQIERSLINGELEPEQALDRFDDLASEILGVKESDVYTGLAQDPHMLEGEFGYFPQYLVALVVSSQFYGAALRSDPSIKEELEKGNEAPLWKWFQDNVAADAGKLPLPELVEKATGKPLGVHDYLSMLWNRYGTPYGVEVPERYKDWPLGA